MQYSSYFIKRLVFLFCVVAVYSQPGLAYDATLRWDPSPDSTVVGYKLHYGTTTKGYATSINVGSQTIYTVTGLGTGTFFFAVTSYNASGTQSSYSNEVSKTFTVVAPPPLPAPTNVTVK